MPARSRVMSVDELDDLGHLLSRQDGVISAAQAGRCLSPAAIRHRLRSGRWQRLHRGIFLANSGQMGQDQRLWLAVLATGPDAVLAGPSATARYGLHAVPSMIHLLLPAHRHPSRPPAGVIIHRGDPLPEADIRRNGSPPRTPPARSIVDAASWAETDTLARAVVAAGFQRGLVSRKEIFDLLDRLPRARRRALILRTADDAAGGSHSLAELDYLRGNRAAGLPEPARQDVRVDARGRRRYLDAYYPEWGVHVEIDGAQHLDVLTSWADMRRQNDLWIKGDRVLRFPAWLVRERSDEVFAQVRAALLAAGWTPDVSGGSPRRGHRRRST